jgi:hypothetical protein
MERIEYFEQSGMHFSCFLKVSKCAPGQKKCGIISLDLDLATPIISIIYEG